MLQNFKYKKLITVLAIAIGVVSSGVWMGARTAPAAPMIPVIPDKILSYVEDGVLYQLPTAAGATRASILVQDARVSVLHVNHDLNETLFMASPKNPKNPDYTIHGKGELWLLDEAGTARKVSSEEPIDASLSPDGTQIAFVSDLAKKVKILTRDGALIRTLPGRSWGTIVWSHDGKRVAYTKLASPPCEEGRDIINSDLCKVGIALFDLESGTEAILTEDGNDYGPTAFSPDDSKLYISSGRPYVEWPEAHVVSDWMVDLATKQAKRLTNHFRGFEAQMDYVPTLNKADTLWSSDGSVAFSSRAFSEGTWMFSFSPAGEIEDAKHIADGDSPRWLVRDSTAITHVIRNGKSAWQPVVLQ
jgi:Tol biopolymer transport system component